MVMSKPLKKSKAETETRVTLESQQRCETLHMHHAQMIYGGPDKINLPRSLARTHPGMPRNWSEPVADIERAA